jgi:hypothetical protein
MAASAALLIGANSQAAASKIVHTDFFISSGFETYGPHFFEVEVAGRINSPKPRCVKKRQVKLYFKRNGERYLRDVGRSSRNGAVALTAHARARPDRYIVVVTKKQIQNPRPYTCWRAHDGSKPFTF